VVASRNLFERSPEEISPASPFGEALWLNQDPDVRLVKAVHDENSDRIFGTLHSLLAIPA
jgi:hypothetical protein